MRIGIVTPEVAPFSKTGGLADVCGALPVEFARLGHEVAVISPLYRSARAHGLDPTPLRVRVPLGSNGVEASVFRSGHHFFIDHPPFYDREGFYGTARGDYEDNAARFTLLSKGALELLRALDWRPDVLHVHDWQTALVPVYVKTRAKDAFAGVKTVLTVHNLAYQGLFWHLDMSLFGLDWSLFTWKQLEFYGKVNLLKGGLVFADAVTTVSPTYAREIQTPELGGGLDGVLRERASSVVGILNGADYSVWDPSTDRHLAANYSPQAMQGKARCKEALQRRARLPVRPDAPIFAMIGRLVQQKGFDLVVEAAELLVQLDVQIVLLGSGDPRFLLPLQRLGRLYGDRLSMEVAFDEAYAHQIEAGADFFIMPSRFEPCGLNQLYSLRYGAVPVVRRTGGLADTIVDGKTGIVFDAYETEALVEAMQRALALYADRSRYRAVQRAGMEQDFSWSVSARKYLELFERL
ncbi:MAG: glycogen synthase GlgA [Planctomycetes bacterium]|nr:glycogen synthase GlgA [Planctomycetota bacterium]